MRAWKRGLAIVLAVAVSALILVACGHGEFSSKTPDIPAAADAAGSQVIDEGTAPNRFAGGTEASWYAVSRTDSAEDGVLVGVLSFDSQKARDRAFTEIQYRTDSLPNSVVYTSGDSVVVVGRIRDRALLQDLAGELEAAGAK